MKSVQKGEGNYIGKDLLKWYILSLEWKKGVMCGEGVN